MPANAALYLCASTPPVIDLLRRVAPLAEVSLVSPPDPGTSGGYVVQAREWRLQLNVMPTEEVAQHLLGFGGYVIHVSGGGRTPEARAVQAQLGEVRLVLGCILTPGFDAAGEARRVISALAAAGRGLVFAHD